MFFTMKFLNLKFSSEFVDFAGDFSVYILYIYEEVATES